MHQVDVAAQRQRVGITLSRRGRARGLLSGIVGRGCRVLGTRRQGCDQEGSDEQAKMRRSRDSVRPQVVGYRWFGGQDMAVGRSERRPNQGRSSGTQDAEDSAP
jgi:hypothetical protein